MCTLPSIALVVLIPATLRVSVNTSPIPGFARNVVQKYFTEYFPRAVQIGEEMANTTIPATMKSKPASVWTTHAWLISLYVDCPLGMGFTCPSAADVAAFKDSVAKGHIAWHAFPFNSELDTLDAHMADFGVKMSQVSGEAWL